MYRCILVPVDGTAFGEHALALAASVARRTGATLHLAHVHVPAVSPVGMDAVATAGPWNEILREQEGEYLRGLAERIDDAVDELRRGLENNPMSAKHHFVLANLLHKKSRLYEAIDEYEATLELRPDFVLLDIGLPDMDGYEVAQKLRQHDSFAATPIIAMTGYGGEAEQNRAQAAGFDQYLVKPVNLERLLSVLRETAGNQF